MFQCVQEGLLNLSISRLQVDEKIYSGISHVKFISSTIRNIFYLQLLQVVTPISEFHNLDFAISHHKFGFPNSTLQICIFIFYSHIIAK